MLRTLLFLIALGSGGMAAWVTLAMQEPPPPATSIAAEPPPAPPVREILVAARDVEYGDKLSPAELAWQTWPEEAVHPAFISRDARPDAPDELAGSFVRQPIGWGEPVRDDKLATGAGLLSASLPSGKRAVAIRISAENTAGGFILPNDRVDVLHTSSNRSASGRLTNTILRNVRVLAIDQRARDDGGESVVGRTATLELDPVQSETITAAETSGQLSLALRSVADSSEPQAVVKEAETENRTIRIFRAGRSEIVPIR